MLVTLVNISIRSFGRLRSKMLQVPGGQLFLMPPQDLRIGGKLRARDFGKRREKVYVCREHTAIGGVERAGPPPK